MTAEQNPYPRRKPNEILHISTSILLRHRSPHKNDVICITDRSGKIPLHSIYNWVPDAFPRSFPSYREDLVAAVECIWI